MHPHLNESRLSFSKHFFEDRQHRGITPDVLELITEYGEYNYTRGAKEYYLSEKSIKQMKRMGMSSQKIQNYEKLKNIRVIISEAGLVITALFANNSRKSIRHQKSSQHRNKLH